MADHQHHNYARARSVEEQQEHQEQLQHYENPYIAYHSLIANEEAAAAAQPYPSPTPQYQQAFDPRALLNPRSVAPKRPATEQEHERGRESDAPGQVSLVERLHNVHERTASPAKKVKTEDDHKKKTNSHTSFGGGGALDLSKPQSEPATLIAQPGPSIDLTMSKPSLCVWL